MKVTIAGLAIALTMLSMAACRVQTTTTTTNADTVTVSKEMTKREIFRAGVYHNYPKESHIVVDYKGKSYQDEFIVLSDTGNIYWVDVSVDNPISFNEEILLGVIPQDKVKIVFIEQPVESASINKEYTEHTNSSPKVNKGWADREI